MTLCMSSKTRFSFTSKKIFAALSKVSFENFPCLKESAPRRKGIRTFL